MERALDYMLQIALAVGGIVLSWLHVLQRDEVRGMKTAIAKAESTALDAKKAADEAKQSAVVIAFEAGKALGDHKLYAAETFARKDEMKELIAALEERLGERFDDIRALIQRGQ